MEKMSVEQLSKSYEATKEAFKKYVQTVANIRTKEEFLNSPILRVFVSVPMHGRAEEEILADIEEAKGAFNKFFGLDFDGDKVQFMDAYTREDAPDETLHKSMWYKDNVRNDRLWYLGDAIKDMAICDIILFARDSYKAKGCQIEDYVASTYNIPSIKIYRKNKRDKTDFDYTNGFLVLFVPDKEESKPKYMTEEAYNEWRNEMDEEDCVE